jgi:serralysin
MKPQCRLLKGAGLAVLCQEHVALMDQHPEPCSHPHYCNSVTQSSRSEQLVACVNVALTCHYCGNSAHSSDIEDQYFNGARMTDIRFSSLTNGMTVNFNPISDRILFDQEAYDVDLDYGDSTHFTISVFGKGVTFQASIFDLVGGADGNIVTANGTIWSFGDNERTNPDPNPATTDAGPNLKQGTNGGDHLEGYDGNDVLSGGDGDDALYGGAGSDVLDGGAGIDYVALNGGTFYVNLALREARNESGDTDNLINIEQVYTSSGNDILIGDDGDNLFGAGAGNDSLNGGGGDDILRPGKGVDTIDGGTGFDELAYHDTAPLNGIQIDLGNGSGTVTDPWGSLDTFFSIEAIRGSRLSDTIIGSASDNRFRGFAGNDFIDGRGGNDWIDYSREASDYTNRTGQSGSVSINLQTGLAMDPYGATDHLTSIEGVIGSEDNDLIIGSSTDNFRLDGLGGRDTISGLAGNDTIDGGAGDDWLDGGGGNDLLRGGEGANDVATFSGRRSDYRVTQSADASVVVTDKRAGADGQDIVTGVEFFQFSDGLVGQASLLAGNPNEAPTSLTLSNAAVGENSQIGTIVGLLAASDPDPNDTLSFRLLDDAGGRFAIVGNQLVVANGGLLDYERGAGYSIMVRASDRVGAFHDQVVTIALVDVASERATGSSGADVIYGGVGNDTLNGEKGNDNLNGGIGSDKLYGGAGNDILTGGAGKDTFVFNSKLDKKANLDKIADFNIKDDTIWLDNAIFKALGTKGTPTKPVKLDSKMFWTGSAAHDADDHILYNKKTGVIYYDTDGAGGKAAVQFAQVKKGLSLTAADFYVI